MNHKQKSIVIIFLLYIISFLLATIPYFLIHKILFSSLVFTLSATLPIFILSCILKDTSLYDPYWSVEPPVLLIMNIIRYKTYTMNALLLLSIFLLWSIRLTYNWYDTYKGIGQEDWRYHDFRKRLNPLHFFLINLTGFQYVPTLVVYFGMVPAILLLKKEFKIVSLIGCLIMLVGILLEYISDTTMHVFLRKKNKKGKTCNIGIWKYSRHPNYLGELLFWFGIMLAYILTCPETWYYGIGSIGIDCVFIFASIPLMEKHNLSRRKDYEKYRKETSILFLWPKKKYGESSL